LVDLEHPLLLAVSTTLFATNQFSIDLISADLVSTDLVSTDLASTDLASTDLASTDLVFALYQVSLVRGDGFHLPSSPFSLA